MGGNIETAIYVKRCTLTSVFAGGKSLQRETYIYIRTEQSRQVTLFIQFLPVTRMRKLVLVEKDLKCAELKTSYSNVGAYSRAKKTVLHDTWGPNTLPTTEKKPRSWKLRQAAQYT